MKFFSGRIKINGKRTIWGYPLLVLHLIVLTCVSCSNTGGTFPLADQNQLIRTQTLAGTQPTATITPTTDQISQPPSPSPTPAAIVLRFPAIRQQCRLVDSGAVYQGEPVLQTGSDCLPNEQQNDTLWGIAEDDTGTPIPVLLLDPSTDPMDDALAGLLPYRSVIHLAYGNLSGAFAVEGFLDYSDHPTQYGLLGLSYQGRSILVIISIAIEPPLPTPTP